MPMRGEVEAGEILTSRNHSNRDVYRDLTPDQKACLEAPLFYALAGYPDYSAVAIEDYKDDSNPHVLVPQVPPLSDEQEAFYRPIWDAMVDPAKVAKKRAENLTTSAEMMEKRSKKAFQKNTMQVRIRIRSLPWFSYLTDVFW